MITSAVGFEQNHLRPVRNHPPSRCTAWVAVLPTSEPPCCSVMNMAPVARRCGSVLVSASTYCWCSGPPNLRRRRAAESVMLIGQKRPNSAWMNS